MSGYDVVIPAFNAAATIGEALATVFAQTIAPARVIVVDDGSSDDTAARAAGDPRVIVVRQSNGGPGAATTAGLALVRAEFVATLDADDLWLPTKMAVQLARLAAEPDLAGVFARAELFRDAGAPEPPGGPPTQDLWTRTTMVYRTRLAQEIGAMRDFPGRLGEFIDWMARGRDRGHRTALVDEVLARRRIRQGSLSWDTSPDRRRDYLAVVRAALARRAGTDGPDGAR